MSHKKIVMLVKIIMVLLERLKKTLFDEKSTITRTFTTNVLKFNTKLA